MISGPMRRSRRVLQRRCRYGFAQPFDLLGVDRRCEVKRSRRTADAVYSHSCVNKKGLVYMRFSESVRSP